MSSLKNTNDTGYPNRTFDIKGDPAARPTPKSWPKDGKPQTGE